MRQAHLALPILLAVASTARAEPTAADRESARVAFTQGNELRDAGDVRGALEKYKAAYALAPTPVTALEVGRAESDLGQLVEAREVLLHVEGMSGDAAESAKSRASRREAALLAHKLARRIPAITLRLRGPAGAVTFSVDGVALPPAALSVARALDPGRHVVVAAAGGRTVQRTVDLREGEARDVALDVTSIAPSGGVVGLGVPAMSPAPPPGASGLVAFTTSDDHAWSLRDPGGHDVCKLPCAQALGFAAGFSVVRDDGEHVEVPMGLAPLPGSHAQVAAYGPAGSAALGWIFIGVGLAAVIASLPVLFVSEDGVAGGFSTSGIIAFGVVLGAGTILGSVGGFVLALSHGTMLVRTDTGLPMRIADGPTIRFGPTGIGGTF